MPQLGPEEEEAPVEQELVPSKSLGQRLLALVWKSKTEEVSAVVAGEKLPGNTRFTYSLIHIFFTLFNIII